MKRFLTSAAAAAMLVAGTGSGARAQTVFDLGVYGGGQWTTDWFEIGDDGYSPGPGFITGAQATFWTTPTFGVRLNGSYFPTGAPQADDQALGDDEYALNNYFADLDLMFRPWTGSTGRLMSSAYIFLGGGAMWTNVAGDPREDVVECLPEFARSAVCLSYEPSYAAVGQGTAGLGFDLFPLGPLGLFGELAVHGYDSPAHTYNDNVAEDKFAFTPRAVLGLKLGFGGGVEDVVVIPPMAPPPPPPPPAPVAVAENAIRVCVVQNGQLTDVNAIYRPTMGDTLVDQGGQRRPFGAVYGATGPTYAGGTTWFINNDVVRFNNRDYVRFGVPRVITPAELTRAGEFQGTGVWTETAAGATANVIYVPIRPGCEFQAYQVRETIRVRG